MSFIYKIVNTINGKCYIGKTDGTIEHRFQKHIGDMNCKANANRPLYKAFKKYGIENFRVEKIEECSQKEAPEREIYWIDFFNSYAGKENSNGYNVTIGGDGFSKYDDDLIWEKYLELNNIRQTANYFNCDRRVVRRVINSKGVFNPPPKVRRIYQLNKKTFEKINEFESIKTASEHLLDSSHTIAGLINAIRIACKDQTKTSLGFRWCYSEDYDAILQNKEKIEEAIHEKKKARINKLSESKKIPKEEEQQIIDLFLSGENIKNIAKKIKRNEETVGNVLKRNGHGDKISHNRQYNYIKIYNEYLKCGSKKETAKKNGCCIGTVNRAIQNNLTS